MKSYPIPRTSAVSLRQLEKIDLKPEVELLGPPFHERSLGMVFGPRGSGKTLVATLIGYGVAGGKKVVPWGIGSGAVVAYLDGEMRIRGFKERLLSLKRFDPSKAAREKAADNFIIISRDLVGQPIGHIDTEEGQKSIEAFLPPNVSLIIVDNLSAWSEAGGEGSSWQQMKQWLIAMRLRGIAVLLVHHSGKNGAQRGTSAHEDLLDYSIRVTPVAVADPSRTVFDIEHTKLRDHLPELRQKFRFQFWQEGDKLMFESDAVASKVDELRAKIGELLKANPKMTKIEIATACGVDRSTIYRVLKATKSDAAEDEPDSAG